jgi:serine/threonine-protein kinase
MSEVYEAFRIDGGEPAAVKLLHRDTMGDPQHLRRFLRELRITAELDLPHVVKVHEVGDESAPIPYLAMELLHGADLAQILRERRRLEHDIVIDMLEQVGQGVDAAHGAGVVHRDLKPQNLFRHQFSDGRHEWKILDFGVSRMLDGSSSLTDGHAVGTPSYMAPEQARGREATHRADLFALGVVAYRALVGRPAFGGREIPHIMQEVVYGMPPQPSLVGLPLAVDDVLAIAIAKSPDDRFSSAAELVQALSRALKGDDDLELGLRAERLLAKLPWGTSATNRRS